MGKITLFLVAGLICLNSYSQDLQRLDKSDIDTAKCQIAKKFSVEFYTKLKNGSYYQFMDEASDAVKTQMTEAVQKAAYKQIKDNFGDFQSLTYSETWIQKSNPGMKIYRFKGVFDKSKDQLEIRVVITNTGKIAGFWIKPWSDSLQ